MTTNSALSNTALDKLSHPCFPQPADTSIRVWRYLDIPKIIWTLHNRKLFLPRLDALGDPLEGSLPRLSIEERESIVLASNGIPSVEERKVMTKKMIEYTYASCWHMNNYESEAMWRLYCPGDQGVAIQTTYEKLVASIAYDSSLFIGQVSYIDYETESLPLDNLLAPAMHKRVAFSHENEARIIKTSLTNFGVKVPYGEPFFAAEWEPALAIEKVFINPYSPPWYFEVVEAIISKFVPELAGRIEWSAMKTLPKH